MKRSIFGIGYAILVLHGSWAEASVDSNGPNGINSSALSLTGDGVAIGQVENGRPGSQSFDTNPLSGPLYHVAVTPAGVFRRHPQNLHFIANPDNGAEISAHAVQIAGLMISTDPTAKGVAPEADLFSVGIVPTGPTAEDVYVQTALSAQHIARLMGQDVRAINLSINIGPNNATPDGTSTVTRFLDWSTEAHEVLYVVAGFENNQPGPLPTDNFNGITVGSSSKSSTKWDQVDSSNIIITDGSRALIDLIAPGRDVVLTNPGSTLTQPPHPFGTSNAAPHVTGTVALLLEHAAAQMPSNPSARRPKVMKAVLLNSADKIQGILGMERTVLKQDGVDTWFQSTAHTSANVPLDEEMGAGHLNANRAFQQFQPGQTGPGQIPLIGWDFAGINDPDNPNKYVFNQQLAAGDYVSLTLAWDRILALDEPAPPFEEYNPDDAFFDFGFSNLDLHLLPAGATNKNQAIASSTSTAENLEHIFASITTPGNYEIWVELNDQTPFASAEYALAWWGGAAQSSASSGDFNGDHVVDAQDYAVWRGGFGLTVTAGTEADGNSNGVIDAADYVVWRNNLTVGRGSFAAVPEPSGLMLLAVAGALCQASRERRKGVTVRTR
jgi:hypothetical protein